MDKAGSVPLSAGKSSGDMAKSTKRMGEEDGPGSQQDGTKGFGKNNKAVPSERAQMVGVSTAAPEGNICCKLDPESIRGEREEMVGFNISQGNGFYARGIGQSSGVPCGSPPDAAKDKPRMEDGTQRSRSGSEATKANSGEDSHMGINEVSNRSGERSNDKGGIRNYVGDGREGCRYHEAYSRGSVSDEQAYKSKVHCGKDCKQSAIYSEHDKNFESCTKVCLNKTEGEETGRERAYLAVPETVSRIPTFGSEEGRSGLGNEVSEAGGLTGFSGNGSNRCGVVGIQPTSKHRNPAALPGFRMAIGRNGGEEQEGGSTSSKVVEKGSENKTPKYVKKNYIDPPSWEEMQKAFPNNAIIQRAFLELNVSRVEAGSIKQLLELDYLHADCKEFLKQNYRIIHDVKFYEDKIGTNTAGKFLPRPSLSKEEINKLLDYKIEKVQNKPVWGTLPFKVAEPHKNRCRAIFDCKLNDIFLKAPKYSLKSKTAIRRALNALDNDAVFIQFDFKSFYDQIILDESVRKYFGFWGYDNSFYQLRLLPMGFRLAVALAQSIMWALLDFAKSEEVSIATCIDNVAFAGPREKVYETIIMFLLRVEKCNFSLHGFSEKKFTPLSEEERRSFLKNLEETNPEFLGEKYALRKKTRAISQKTVTKVELVWAALGPQIIERKHGFSNRQFFCLVGLLVYATDVLDLKTQNYFNLFRKIRELSRKLSLNELKWDDPMKLVFSNLEINKLEEWTKSVLRNEPVDLLRGRKEIPNLLSCCADVYIVTDASKDGWGALFFNSQKEFTHFQKGTWPRGDFRASTKAEPLAIEKVAKNNKTQMSGKRIAFLTDHENLCFASRALFAHSYFYNRTLNCLAKLQKEEGSTFYIYYVEGIHNTADGISRGQEAVVSTSFPVVGAGLESALPLPWQL